MAEIEKTIRALREEIRALQIRVAALEERLRPEPEPSIPPALNLLPLLGEMTFETFRDRPELSPRLRDRLQAAVRAARAYAADPRGWLVLAGPHGSGKTHLAAAIAHEAVARGIPVLFVTVLDLLDWLRAIFHPGNSHRPEPRRFEAVKQAPLLVLDDLETEGLTPWAQGKLYQLLNHRYLARLPTVITTAAPLERLDPRIAARLSDESRGQVVLLDLPPFRAFGG